MDASIQGQLELLKIRAEQGQLSREEAAAWYELVGELREVANYYERGLVRYLKYDAGMKWREVAEVVGVAGRQGAFQRWRRLIGPPREVRRS